MVLEPLDLLDSKLLGFGDKVFAALVVLFGRHTVRLELQIWPVEIAASIEHFEHAVEPLDSLQGQSIGDLVLLGLGLLLGLRAQLALLAGQGSLLLQSLLALLSSLLAAFADLLLQHLAPGKGIVALRLRFGRVLQPRIWISGPPV